LFDFTINFSYSKPGDYVSHLLGHEARGSLLYELKRRGWAYELSAYQETVAHGFGFFKVEIDLTIDGFQNADKVVQRVFEFINTVLTKPAEQRIFDEIQNLRSLHYHYQVNDCIRS